MSYEIKATTYFIEQLDNVSKKAKTLIENKIQLIKENPFRYKKIHSQKFSKVFRVRLNIDGMESRMIYTVIEPNIIIVALLARKDEYKDLEKYLGELKK